MRRGESLAGEDAAQVLATLLWMAPSGTQRNMIIACKLGATGKLPDTVGS